jgi:hypothetical protein
MNWCRWLAAFFVMLALVRCAQGITVQDPARYTPYSLGNDGNMPEHGGGDGGSGGGGGGGM